MSVSAGGLGTIRLLGLDPGLRNTGWGVIDVAGNRLRHVANGVLHSTSGLEISRRLLELHDGVAAIIDRYAPAAAAAEETFVNKNPDSTLKLGLARGAVLLAPARAGLPVFEYAPNRVKKSVVGVGHADKIQVQTMVSRLLPGCRFESPDAADALAVAICHAHFAQSARTTSTRTTSTTSTSATSTSARRVAAPGRGAAAS